MRLATAQAGLIAINNPGWAIAQEKSLKGNDLSVGTLVVPKSILGGTWINIFLFYFKNYVFNFTVIYSK